MESQLEFLAQIVERYRAIEFSLHDFHGRGADGQMNGSARAKQNLQEPNAVRRPACSGECKYQIRCRHKKPQRTQGCERGISLAQIPSLLRNGEPHA